MSASPSVVVVLAAGLGSRLGSQNSVPKPLRPVAGRPLILSVLDRFAECGVDEAVVVIGYRGEEVRRGIEAEAPAGRVTFVENPFFEKSNGLSILAAKEAVGQRNFFLSMADHIFDGNLVSGLARAPIPSGGAVLAVDRKLDSIYDMDDATKVLTDGRNILEINKNLLKFDAVDTGLFTCTPALFQILESVVSSRPDGDCSLSDGITALAAQKKAAVYDIGAGNWQDVDTPGAREHAESMFG